MVSSSAKVGFLHVTVGDDLRRRAFADDPSRVEAHDALREAHHRLHDVLDHDYRDSRGVQVEQDSQDFVDFAAYEAATPPGFAALGQASDGKLAGIFTKGAVKGLIWYNTGVWTGGAPATWDELKTAAAGAVSGDQQNVAAPGQSPKNRLVVTGAFSPTDDLILIRRVSTLMRVVRL